MSPSEREQQDLLRIRSMTIYDEPSVVALLSRTLGWAEDQGHAELFAWKHRLNPFGPSPGWIMEDEQGVAGFRTLMRWEFINAGGDIIKAARAVDTATDPRAQGRGIFKALTREAVEAMTEEGVEFLFNTPNAQSAPGYLSMGWLPMGRLPVSFRLSSLAGLPRMVSARAPADLWSLPTTAGESAIEVLSDEAAILELLDSTPHAARGLRTNRNPAFLRWRYGLCPVGYRILLAGSRIEEGLVIFRLRRRGGATEATIADTLVPDPALRRRLYTQLLAASGADYAVALGASRPPAWLPLPIKGPLLTWRRLNWQPDAPYRSDWALTTGDVELF